MRHIKARIKKKKKPLTLFTNTKLLHSNSKSTYFYKQWLDSFSSLRKQFANGFWVNLSSSREDSSTPITPSANRTRFSLRDTNPYSKLTCGGIKRLLPVFCMTALLLVLGISINPIVSSAEVYADEAATQADTNTSIKLTVGNNTLTNATAKAGEVNYLSTTVNVEVTDVSGYKMYVQAAPGSSAILTNGGTKIEGVGSNVVTADFGDNKWGYALDATGTSVENLTYSTVPENGAALNPAYATSEVSETKNFNLAFAAKFGTDAAPGHYGTNVLLSVAAGADVTAGLFDGITTMQQMTNGICSRAEENDTVQLEDTRDHKKYWIAKLRDGNCWMTQNLDLDIPAGGLKAADTDIPVDWNSSSAYPPVETKDTVDGWVGKSGNVSAASVNLVQSYDAGVVLCNSATESCYSVDGDYDAHYTSGNYYSWMAATAGAGNYDFKEGNIEQSICPKGWTLPSSGGLEALFKSYGTWQSYTLVYGSQNITLAPLYFTKAGYVDADGYANAGKTGVYATSTAGGTTRPSQAYVLNFSKSTSFANDNVVSMKVVGITMRCVVR